MKLGSQKVKINLRKSRFWISLISITLIASGCHEDLSKIQEFSKVSGTIKETSEKLGKDIYESCIRRENRLDETEKIQSTFASSITGSRIQLPPSLSTIPNPFAPNERDELYTFAPIKMDERCDQYKPVAQSTIQANLLVVNYLESLGQLAGDQQVSFNQSLTDLGGAITNLNPTFQEAKIPININPNYVKAGENIVSFLVDKFFIKPVQEESLKSVMVCQDTNFQEYTSLLKMIAQDVYLNQSWEKEKVILYRYFEERARLAPYRYVNNMQDFANEISTITQEYTKDKAQLNERKEQAETYIALISLTAQNHHKLAMILGNDMNEKEIQSFCPQNASPNTSGISQNLESPSQEQLKEAKKVLNNYLKEAKPLVEELNR